VRFKRIAAVVFVALVLRLMILPLTFNRVPVGDPVNYIALATNVISGAGFVHKGFFAHYPPLYPLLLSAVGLVAPLKAQTFLVLNFIFDMATAAAILWLSRLMNIRRGWIPAAVYLLWPTNILMAPIANKESLATLFVCLAVGCFVTRRWALFGVVSGLLALCQPALVTLPPLMALALRSEPWRDWVKHCAIGTAIAALVMSPWWIRNYLIYRQFVPLTDSAGWALWIGTFSDRWATLPPHLMANKDGLKIGMLAWNEATAWILAHPWEWLQHNWSKALTMMQPDNWNRKPLAWMRPEMIPTKAMISVPWFASAGLFIGTIGGLLAVKGPVRNVVIAGLFQLFVIQVWFEFPERHRYFLIPLLMLLVTALANRVLAARIRRGDA
jgi:hypothetical protein